MKGHRQPTKTLPLLGRKYGVYRVVAPAENPYAGNEHAYWRVVCEVCGYSKSVAGHNLVRGFPLQCNHVPPGHRVVGPREAAVLDAIRNLTTESLESFGGGGTNWQVFARAALALRQGSEVA
jgi:hypothetical protein